MHKKLVMATLTSAKLQLTSPRGDLLQEETLSGRKVKARVEQSPPELFVITIDAGNFKFKAQSAAEAREWVDAVHAAFKDTQ